MRRKPTSCKDLREELKQIHKGRKSRRKSGRNNDQVDKIKVKSKNIAIKILGRDGAKGV